MAASQCLQHFWPALRARNNVRENLSKYTGRTTMTLSKGEIVCAADLGFSRSAAFGVVRSLKILATYSEAGPTVRPTVTASVLAGPALEVVRMCAFYTLMQTGVAVPSSRLQDNADGASVPGWLDKLMGEDKEAERDKHIIKLRRNWNVTTKGTLVRKYRVPSKPEGRKLLSAICSLLSDDDSFIDVSTHKGCQIRRENAHAESVCCNNVRALFDELPTPHLLVEITVFPAGPITNGHWEKAAKLEKVIKKGNSI